MAYRCRRCNTILCAKCEKGLMWGQMCPQCYRSIVKLDELEVKERVARLLSIYEHQKKRRNTMKVLSFIIPGSSQVFGEKILYGFLLLWPFLCFLTLSLSLTIISPDGFLISHGFIKWVSFFIAIAFYFISNILTRQRIAKGWL